MKSNWDGINPATKPSGTGCVECLALGGWWSHLRGCADCGYIGCCDNSPGKHASKRNAATGHPIITSFEPRALVLRLSQRRILRWPEASRPALASVGSTGAGTGRRGASKLASAALRIGGDSLVGPETTWSYLRLTRPCLRIRPVTDSLVSAGGRCYGRFKSSARSQAQRRENREWHSRYDTQH